MKMNVHEKLSLGDDKFSVKNKFHILSVKIFLHDCQTQVVS